MMSDAEKLTYLTNLVVLARSDGEVPELEMELIKHMAYDIGASRQALQGAMNSFGKMEVNLRSLARFSTQIRCLEDLVAVAIADQEISAEEQYLLIQAVQEIGLTEDLANRIVAEVTRRVSEEG